MRHPIRSVATVLAILLGIASSADADERSRLAEPPGLDPRGIDEDCAQATADEAPAPVPEHAPAVRRLPSQSVAPAATSVPRGRAIGSLGAEECRALLDSLGVAVEDARAEGGPVSAIEQPVRLRGPIGGLAVGPHGGDPRSIHAILDCRLVVALYTWAPTLREAGFVGIEHVSVFRPGARVAATGHPSGHSHALAIDALRFVRPDGTSFSVLDDWTARERGADPCGTYEESDEARALRRAICAGAEAETFEVIVTPHHDDAHRNHVHLEVVPGADWTALR